MKHFTERSCVRCPDCGQVLKEIRIPWPGREELVAHAACSCRLEREEAERKVMADQERQRRMKALFDSSQLGPRFAACTFANWKRAEGAEVVHRAAKSYVEQWPQKLRNGESMLISGAPGNGKSHLAAAIVNELVPRGVAAVFANVPELLGRLRRTYNGSGENESRLLRALVDADLLVLDDLGAQKWSEWSEEMIYYLVNTRYNAKLPLVITTNATTSQLAESIGPRSLSRLDEVCDMVDNKAASYRRHLARERNRGREQD